MASEDARVLSDHSRRPVDPIRLAVELENAATFLYRQGVGDGSAAVDDARAELVRLRAEVEAARARYESLAIGRDAESDANERLRAEVEALKVDRGSCPHCEEDLVKPPEEREKLYALWNLLTDGTDPAGLVEDAIAYLREPVAETDALVAEIEALKAEALDVCGITYGMLTAGIVDDHDRIMRAANELAEFGRRLTGAAPPLDETEAR